MTEQFNIGQTFKGTYPPEAAEWCNNRGDCFIDEINSIAGIRYFEIKEIPPESEDDKRKARIEEIKYLLRQIDIQKIRAVTEPEIKDCATGQTWLDFYNIQANELRAELKNLQGE